MLRRSCQLAFLLLGLIWGGCLGVHAQAELDFTFEPTDPGIGEEVCFEAIVITGDPAWFVLYEWDFTQPPTAAPDEPYEMTGQQVCTTFRTEGDWIITLRGTDDRGGFHTVQKTIRVTNAAPVAAFDYAPAFPIAGSLVSFDGNASFDPDGTITTFEWDFDNDGQFDDGFGRAPRHAFATAGQHPVALRVTDNGGRTATDLQVVSVQPVPPIACFEIDPIAPTIYNNILFIGDCSVDPDGGAIVQYTWSFGDGQFGNGRRVTHQYANGGTYDVTLTITDDDQQTDTFTDTVVVDGPSAAFAYAPLNPTTQDQVQFFDQSSDTTGDIASWTWDFDDGTGSSAQNPTHQFASSGPHRVMLTVTSEGGATSSAMRVINVRNSPPTANFDFDPATPDIDELVTFSAGGSNDQDGTIVSFEWDFDGDGITDATGSTVTFSFSVVGARPVRLTVTDDEGAASQLTKVVPVQAAPPVACFDFTPVDPNTGEAIAFDASCSNDPDGTILLYEWDFDDDGTTDATGMAVTHSFPTAGVYPVTLTVTDNDNAVDADTQGVPVAVGGTSGDNQPPEPDFSIKFPGDEANIGEVVTYQSDGSTDADGTIVAYEWDFDDDGVYDATGAKASHVYHTGGAKIVTLRVTDDDGAFGFKTRVVSVEFVRPSADFTFTPEQPRNGDVVQFDGGSSTDRDGTVEFFEWDFDNDGLTDATGMTVTHVFPDGGAMPVTLTVIDDDGVQDFTTRSVPVMENNPPNASFDFSPIAQNPNKVAVNEAILFESTSRDPDGEIVAYLWDFGDGSDPTSTQTPTHRFTELGTYDVTLTVTDDGGDTGTRTEAVIVFGTEPVPVTANFDWDINGRTVAFTDTSTDPSDRITARTWDFGDGNASSTQRNPTHTFSEGQDTFTITLTLTVTGSEDGDVLTETKTLTIAAVPVLFGYPNPATTQVTIDTGFGNDASDIVLRIYDLGGDAIFEQTLNRATEFIWDLRYGDGTRVANGLYFVAATATVDGSTVRSAVFRLLIRR